MSFPPKTLGEIETEIAMRRRGYAGPYMLLEGDPDSRFWRKHSRLTAKEVITCSGRTNVIAATSLVETKALGPALSVVDDDYDTLLAILSPSVNLVLTDSRDLESTMLSSTALESVLEELGDAPKLEAFTARTSLTPREALVEKSLPFGMARFISIRDGHHVNFDKFRPARYLRPDWEVAVAVFEADFAAMTGISVAALQGQFAALTGVDPWRLIQGHDAIQVLSAGLSHVLGSVNISHDLLCAFLRSSFDTSILRGMPLWNRITVWETQNGVQLVSP